MTSLQAIALLLLLTASCSAQSYSLKINSLDPQAKCLDGSSPALIVHEGCTPENILIYTYGNYSCGGVSVNMKESLDDCVRRTKTWEGSSKFPFPFNPQNGLGILETNQTMSKFATWTKIIVPDCSGAAFQGYNKDPVEHEDAKIYFRGSAIMRSHFKWIDENYGLEKAGKIVLAGTSFGAIAVSLWIDYLKGLVTQPKKVYGVIDSLQLVDETQVGFFYLFNSQMSSLAGFPSTSSYIPVRRNLQQVPIGIAPGGGAPKAQSQSPVRPGQAKTKNFENFLKISNKDERPPHKKCVEAHEDPKDDWKCVFGTPNIDSHNSKFLWIQSQYDMFLMKRVFYVSCITEGETTYTLSECLPSQIVAIDLTRSFLLQKTLYPLSERGHSVWSNACVWNGALMKSSMYFSDKLRAAVGGRKLTIQEAVEKFVFEDEIIEEVDAYSWPYNSECAF